MDAPERAVPFAIRLVRGDRFDEAALTQARHKEIRDQLRQEHLVFADLVSLDRMWSPGSGPDGSSFTRQAPKFLWSLMRARLPVSIQALADAAQSSDDERAIKQALKRLATQMQGHGSMRPARGDRPAHRVKLIELTPDPEPMARLTTTDPTSVCMVVPVAFDRRYVTWTGDVEVATHERGHALESPPVVVKIDGLGTGFPGRSFIDFHVSVCAREPAVVTGFELEIRLGRYSVHYPWSPLTDDPNRGDWFVDCGELTNRDKYLAARCAIQPEFAAPIGRAGTLVGWVRFDLPDLPKRDFPGGDATGTFKAILQQGPSATASFPIALPRRPTAEHMAEVAARLRDEGAKDDSTP